MKIEKKIIIKYNTLVYIVNTWMELQYVLNEQKVWGEMNIIILNLFTNFIIRLQGSITSVIRDLKVQMKYVFRPHVERVWSG